MKKSGRTNKVAPTKQVASEMLPSRHALAQITNSSPFARRLGRYAKASPADASGEGTVGLNIFSRADPA